MCHCDQTAKGIREQKNKSIVLERWRTYEEKRRGVLGSLTWALGENKSPRQSPKQKPYRNLLLTLIDKALKGENSTEDFTVSIQTHPCWLMQKLQDPSWLECHLKSSQLRSTHEIYSLHVAWRLGKHSSHGKKHELLAHLCWLFGIVQKFSRTEP